MCVHKLAGLSVGSLILCLTSFAADAADWSILSQDDFGANGLIEIDDVVVAEWSATMDPISGFQHSWYSATPDEGLIIGLAGLSDQSPHEADISLMITPMPGFNIPVLQWGQSEVPIHTVGGSLTFSGFAGAAQLKRSTRSRDHQPGRGNLRNGPFYDRAT